MKRFNRKTGASLIEILVVIVVFLVGILAIAQIFPGGLTILRTTRNNTVATSLIRAELERLKSQADQLPTAILPTRWEFDAGTGKFRVVADLNRRPGDLGPAGAVGLDIDGFFLDASNQKMGRWQYLSGANVMTRVIAETRTVPAPRYLSQPTSTGNSYGGLMACSFAPVIYDADYPETFLVYGNDLQLRVVEQVDPSFPVRQDYVALVDEAGEFLALPQGPYRGDVTNYARTYRLSCSAYVDRGGQTVQKDVIVKLLTVPSPAIGQRRGYVVFDLKAELTGPGETFIRADIDTIQVARVFDQIGSPMAPQFLTEADVRNSATLRDDAAYQYDFVDDKLGLMLFNPLGFNYQERRGRGRVPLNARVDYDVYDWRLMRDDFRVPNQMPFDQKLVLNTIKVKNNNYADQRKYTGVGFNVADINGQPEERDFVLVDTETGGVYLPTCYTVDKSVGLVQFIDDPAVTNDPDQLGAQIMYPRATAPVSLKDIRGRSVRAIYQGVNEWSIQVEKAVRAYQVVWEMSLGYRQAYVGGSNVNITNDDDTRVYFPVTEIGKQVILGEIWYENEFTGDLEVAYEQQFIVQAPRPGEPDLGFVDINDSLQALSLRFDNGYAVRRIRGASVGVRSLWNPLTFTLTADPVENLRRYESWQRGWRRSRTETFLMGGLNN